MAEEKRRFQPLKLFRGAFEWTIYTEDGSEVAFEVYDEAYAHLFAAAPDLYEACSKVFEELVNVDCDCAPESGYECLRCCALEKLEFALRKARGEEVEADG